MHLSEEGVVRDEHVPPQNAISQLLSTANNSEQSDEDSDAEFLVHPILRSLIKSKSAYTMKTGAPSMVVSKTAFEINLSQMCEANSEPPVINFTPKLDMKWPEPDKPTWKRKKNSMRSRKCSCSSVLNDESDGESTPSSIMDHSGCWSAPECLESSERRDHIGSVACAKLRLDRDVYGDVEFNTWNQTTGSTYKDSDINNTYPMQQSEPQLSSFFNDLTSDDDSPQRNPHQEVWPEEDVMSRSTRRGWTLPASTNSVLRSQSSLLNSDYGQIREKMDVNHPIRDQSRLLSNHPTNALFSELDDLERRDLLTRSEWINRGDKTMFMEHSVDHKKNETFGRVPRYNQSNIEVNSTDHIRRSYTTDELKRERRKLPRRPDVLPFYNDLPSAVLLPDHHLVNNSTEQHLQQNDVSLGNFDSLYSPSRPTYKRGNSVAVESNRSWITDISEPHPLSVNPSTISLSVRRLPFFSASQLRRYPEMSIPHQNTIAKPQDHTLCFIDGMSDSMMCRSAFEDSYYEEDGINGNTRVKQRKC